MYVSLGMNLQPGPWGGGNQFGHALTNYLRSQGVKVSFDLQAPDLDVILLTEPRPNMKISAYSDKDIGKYLLQKNSHAIVIHRINECDERKGTTGVNQRLIRANTCADFTVFISSWLSQLFLGHGLKTPDSRVILNGANVAIFNAQGYIPWNGTSKLKLVTHHWGAGYLKGFDIYERLDRMLSEPAFRDKFEFTYIGNVPDNINFTQTKLIPPQSGVELAKSIRSHHVYLTASQNEPAGMHHIEGAMCGLPLLYRESGALPEYCQGFGVSFTAENFEQKLQEMMTTYEHWTAQMKNYPHTAERMCKDYYHLFLELLERRDEIIKQRQWWRKPVWLVRTLLP
ncbi:MAG: glycosyltransferase family 4 protein [Anaerolineales bacterium]|nr:glycosyltransferase family 4 protein [Anaerolineales bacterium]